MPGAYPVQQAATTPTERLTAFIESVRQTEKIVSPSRPSAPPPAPAPTKKK